MGVTWRPETKKPPLGGFFRKVGLLASPYGGWTGVARVPTGGLKGADSKSTPMIITTGVLALRADKRSVPVRAAPYWALPHD